MNYLTWPQRSASNFAINMYSAIARQIRPVTASTARLVSNWYSRGDCLPCTRSGEPAIMRRRNNFLKLIPLLLLVPLLAPGQQPPKTESSDTGEAVFSSDTRLVPLNVTVSDKSARLITNLPQSAFQVFENGVAQSIKIFKREDVPVSMGLVIDNSGSMRDKRTAVESAALALVKDSNKSDEAFVVNFNDEV